MLSRRHCAALLSAAFSLALARPASAGSIAENFDAGLPGHAALYGSATAIGGAIRLTDAVPGQRGIIAFADADAGAAIRAWTAEFDFRIGGGTGADGIGLRFAPFNPATDVVAEESEIGLDTYQNPGEPNDNHVSLAFGGSIVALNADLPFDLNDDQWHHLRATLNDGLVDVYLADQLVIDHQLAGWAPSAGQFAIGGRTGDFTDVHSIDNFAGLTTPLTSPVPEPTTALLVGGGIAGLAWFGRQRVRESLLAVRRRA